MKKHVKKLTATTLALLLLFSLGMIAYQHLQYRKSKAISEEAVTLVRFPPSMLDPQATASPDLPASVDELPDPVVQSLLELDIEALQEVSPQVVGWIYIPDTDVSYPVMQGTDNSYYLSHAWNGLNNAAGSIFMDWRNDAALKDFQTILYGHRMNNGSMFGTLRAYADKSFWQIHPHVYLRVENTVYKCPVFAAWEVSIEDELYENEFPDIASKDAFINACLERTCYDTGIVPTTEDRILTMSTCTGHGHATRWVVQAVLGGA